MKHYNKMARQAGMTLIELTVVLLVLIGLAGLLIPYVSGFVSRTHDSTGTNNLAALNGNFARFQNEYMRQPDRLETLVNGTAGAAYSKLMNTDLLQVVTVDGTAAMTSGAAIRSNSLNAAGLQTVIPNDDATTDATFQSTGTNAATDHTAGAVNMAAVCGVDTNAMMAAGCASTAAADVVQHMIDAFGGTTDSYDATCYDYIAFGIGEQSEMIGRTMNSAPIHFAQNGDMGPNNNYNRFVAVYQVDKDNSTAGCSTSTEPAKFVGTAMLMMQTHLWGLGHSAGHAYENLANN